MAVKAGGFSLLGYCYYLISYIIMLLLLVDKVSHGTMRANDGTIESDIRARMKGVAIVITHFYFPRSDPNIARLLSF